MPTTLNPLGLVVPANDNELFDYTEYIVNNFEKINDMKVLGSFQVRNASQFDTIVDAVNDLPSEGGIVFIPAGVYNLSTNQQLIDINAKNNIAIVAEQGAVISLTGPSVDDLTFVIRLTNCKNITIRGLTVKGGFNLSPDNKNNGIVVRDSCENIRIYGNTIEYMGDNGIDVRDDMTVSGNKGRIFIESNLVFEYGGDGIRVVNQANVTCQNNTVTLTNAITPSAISTIALRGYGIDIWAGVGSSSEYNTNRFNNNTILNARKIGIRFYWAGGTWTNRPDAVFVDANNIVGSPTGIEVTPCTRGVSYTRLRISNNIIHNATSFGIHVLDDNHLIVIQNNSLRIQPDTGSQYGIRVNDCDYAQIQNNQIETTSSSNIEYGIQVEDSDKGSIVGNVCYNCGVSPYGAITVANSNYWNISSNFVDSVNASTIGIKVSGNYNSIQSNQAGSSNIAYIYQGSVGNLNNSVGNNYGDVNTLGTDSYVLNNRPYSGSPSWNLIDSPNFKVDYNGKLVKFIAEQTRTQLILPGQCGLVGATLSTETPSTWSVAQVIKLTNGVDCDVTFALKLFRLRTGSSIRIRAFYFSDSGSALTWAGNAYYRRCDTNLGDYSTEGSEVSLGAINVTTPADKTIQKMDFTIAASSLSNDNIIQVRLRRTSGTGVIDIPFIEVSYDEKQEGAVTLP